MSVGDVARHERLGGGRRNVRATETLRRPFERLRADDPAQWAVPRSCEKQRGIKWEVVVVSRVELRVPAKTHWIRPVSIALAPFVAVAVILFGLAVFVPPVTCSLRDPHTRALADIVSIVSATKEFALNHDGHYPTSLDELVEPDDQGYRYLNCRTWPRDPWGNRYLYVPPGESATEPNVMTLGKDGEIGGTGDAEDTDWRTLVKDLDSH